MPTNHFKFSLEHKNSLYTQLPSPLNSSPSRQHIQWALVPLRHQPYVLPSREKATLAPAGAGTTPRPETQLKTFTTVAARFLVHIPTSHPVLFPGGCPRMGRDASTHTWPQTSQRPPPVLLCLSGSWMMNCWICWTMRCYSHVGFAPKWLLHPSEINTRILAKRKRNKVPSVVNEKFVVFWHVNFP